jgi:hypothetical protein
MIQDSPPPGSGRARSGHYSVLRFGDEWRLLHGASTIGQFKSLEAARAVAGSLCRAVANVGFDVDLTVQSYCGELQGEHIPSGLARQEPSQ